MDSPCSNGIKKIKVISNKKVKIPYGRGFYNLNINESFDVLKPKKVTRLKNYEEEIKKQLDEPIGSKSLKEMVKDKKDICIVISDVTRPVPNKEILKILLPYIHRQGIKKENIKIIVATGSHEEPTNREYYKLVGKYIKNNYKILWNDCYSDNFVFSGYESNGYKISVNRDYVKSDFKILIGLIEPHIYAGYSGGRKSIVPGLCDWESFKIMHGSKIIMHPEVKVDGIANNPFHKIATSVAEKVGADFIINVAINEDKDIIGVFCGDLNKAFLKGVSYLREHFKVNTDKKYDLAITNGGGNPLDSYFYQLVKGMNAAVPYIKDGGKILMIAKVENGLGTEQFCRLIKSIKNIDNFIKNIDKDFVMEQWTIQAYYRVFQVADVYLFSPIFERYPFLENFIKRVDDIDKFIDKIKRGKEDFSIGMFLDGPYSF